MSDRHHHDEHAPHGHAHGDERVHAHTHGVVDPSITSTARGLWTLKWSFVGLFATALLQAGVVALSGRVALPGDTIPHFPGAAHALSLRVAVLPVRPGASQRVTPWPPPIDDVPRALS